MDGVGSHEGRYVYIMLTLRLLCASQLFREYPVLMQYFVTNRDLPNDRSIGRMFNGATYGCLGLESTTHVYKA